MPFLFSDKKNKKQIFVTVAVLEESFLCFLSETFGGKIFVISQHENKHGISLGRGLTVDKIRKFRKTLIEILDKVYQDAQKHYNKKSIKLDGAFSLFAPPWLLTDKVDIDLEGRDDVAVSRRDLAGEVAQKFSKVAKTFDNCEEEDVERGSHPWKLSLIEQSVNQIKLNGYVLADPYGKKARKIEAKVLAVSVLPEMQNLLEKEIENFFRIKEVDEVSLPKTLASFSVRNGLKLPAIVLFMDKSTTAVVEVRDEDSYDLEVINCGISQISEAAMKAFGTEDSGVAASYLRLANEKILTKKVSEQIADSVDESLIDWKFQIKNAAADFDSPNFQSVIMVCPRKLKGFFKSFIGELPIRALFKGIEETEEIISNPRNLTIKAL